MPAARPIRIGAVSYLNSRPLVYRLAELAPEAEIHYEVPGQLAEDLAAGNLDVALVPSITYFRMPGCTIVSDACIGCRGPVLSVKLLSRVPIDQIRTLALDAGSRTSVALVQILLEQKHGLRPQLCWLPLGASPDRIDADAVLLIGDRAIQPPPDGFVTQWDLGDEWCRWAELPFVFAMWVARPGVDLQGVDQALSCARDAGVANIEAIARAEAGQVGLTFEQCLVYLRDNLHFYLHRRERQGLRLFYQHCVRLGLAPAGVDVEVDDYQATGQSG